MIDQALETFVIKRSLSINGTPHDHAVVEATFKTMKTEFVNGRVFDNQQELEASKELHPQAVQILEKGIALQNHNCNFLYIPK